WADDDIEIRRDLEEALSDPVNGQAEFLKVMDEYAAACALWPEYPIELEYPVLRAVAEMDAATQQRIEDWLFSRPHEGRAPLVDSILLMLNPERAKEDWLETQAPELIGRTLYYVSPEATHLVG